MAISIATPVTNVLTATTSIQVSLSHAPGKDIIVLVGIRVTTSTQGVSTISYAGSTFTTIVESAAAAATTPFVKIGAYRLTDPAAVTGMIDVTATNPTFGICVIAFDVDGGQSGAGLIGNTSTRVFDSSASLSITLTTTDPAEFVITAIARVPGANFVTLSGSAPLTELVEVQGTAAAGVGVSMGVYTYQKSISGVETYLMVASGVATALAGVALALVQGQTLSATGATPVFTFGGAPPIICPVGFAPPCFGA